MEDRLDEMKEPLRQGKSPKEASEAFFGSEDVKKYLSELLVLEAALTETKDIFMRAIIEKPRELKNMKATVEGQLSSPAGEKLMSDPKLSDKILSGKALEEITSYLPDAMQKVSTPKQPMAKQPEAKKPQGRVL